MGFNIPDYMHYSVDLRVNNVEFSGNQQKRDYSLDDQHSGIDIVIEKDQRKGTYLVKEMISDKEILSNNNLSHDFAIMVAANFYQSCDKIHRLILVGFPDSEGQLFKEDVQKYNIKNNINN